MFVQVFLSTNLNSFHFGLTYLENLFLYQSILCSFVPSRTSSRDGVRVAGYLYTERAKDSRRPGMAIIWNSESIDPRRHRHLSGHPEYSWSGHSLIGSPSVCCSVCPKNLCRKRHISNCFPMCFQKWDRHYPWSQSHVATLLYRVDFHSGTNSFFYFVQRNYHNSSNEPVCLPH